MKVLQIGAGSMGTRRLRDLRSRADVEVRLFDEREDRRTRARDRFGIGTFSRLEEALAWEPRALVISTPPGAKRAFIELALERGLHHFMEADIWSYGSDRIERISREKKLVSAPSSSFAFLPLVTALGEQVRERLGQVISYQCYMATYMPAWHPAEGKEYYARHRNTAPAREMIPFELHWLNALFGPAVEVSGHFEKFGCLPDPTEDTWTLSMRLENGGMGQLAITMACPQDYRRGACFGTEGMASWDIYGGDLTVAAAGGGAPIHRNYGAMASVLEESYRQEIGCFIDTILGRATWPHSYASSQRSSAVLAAAERSHATGTWVKVNPLEDPEISPPGRDASPRRP